MRIGIGHDTHRLATGLPLRLGGVVGHSDAQLLVNAVKTLLFGRRATAKAVGRLCLLRPRQRTADFQKLTRPSRDEVICPGNGLP